MATADATNSFTTLAEAGVYFDARLHTAMWTAASTADKNRALIQASRMLVQYLDWTDGEPDKLAPDVKVKDATCELALVLLGGDLQARDDMDGLKSLAVDGVVSIEASGAKKQIIPTHIRRMLGNLVSGSAGTIDIIRS